MWDTFLPIGKEGPFLTALPGFLVIGAARAGTTALHSYLNQHPEIFMPALKEPNFFAYEGQNLDCKGPGADYINNSITDLSDYQALYASAPETSVRGDASPLYLFEPHAPKNIYKHIPDTRFVVVLRNPIDQAFSHYLYAVKQAIEVETDFTKTLALEEERLAAGWQPLFGYSSFPLYAEQLSRYFEKFPREQFLIRTYEDFRTDPDVLLTDIYQHIGVAADFHADMSAKPNAGGIPKNQAFQEFLMKPNAITRAIGLVVPEKTRHRIRDRLSARNLTKAPEMPSEARAILHERLDPEIRRLETLLDRDFSHWRA